MVKCSAGPDFKEWSISNYYLKQAFDVPDEVISYIFFNILGQLRVEKIVTD